MKITKKQKDELFDALYYLKVDELKDTCRKIGLSITGKKIDLIKNIQSFVEHGKTREILALPEVSKAQKGFEYPLTSETLILYGAYKNDAKTRKFLKIFIGDHFHFTAYGQDWIMDRWREGNPPSYGEFAQFWDAEYYRRKTEKVDPKKEWAYINFLQQYMREYPEQSKEQAIASWNAYRLEQVKNVHRLLSGLILR